MTVLHLPPCKTLADKLAWRILTWTEALVLESAHA